MGPSPTIPTSFVPQQPVHPTARPPRSGVNLIMMGAVFLLVVSLVGAAGVFAYAKYLTGVKETKVAQLKVAQENVDAAVVEEFIRMRDRFLEGKTLLDNHPAFSGFFDVLETITLSNVSFNSLSLILLADGSADMSLSGTARSFNALAAQSAAFSKEPRFKRAIFADIQLATNGTVGFSVAADVQSEVFRFSLPESEVSQETVPVAEPATPSPPSGAAPTQSAPVELAPSAVESAESLPAEEELMEVPSLEPEITTP